MMNANCTDAETGHQLIALQYELQTGQERVVALAGGDRLLHNKMKYHEHIKLAL